MVITSPKAQTKMAAIAKFEQQDWVQQLTGGEKPTKGAVKQHVDPNVAFPFEDDFSVRTIHGTNAANQPTPTSSKVVEIQDNDDDVSILLTKTGVDNQPIHTKVGSRVASGFNPVVGPTADSTQVETAHGGLPDPATAGPADGGAGGPEGK